MSEIPREAISEAVKRLAKDLYCSAVRELIVDHTREKKRIDSRVYERLNLNCIEAAWNLVKAMHGVEVPEGTLNIMWEEINAKDRGK